MDYSVYWQVASPVVTRCINRRQHGAHSSCSKLPLCFTYANRFVIFVTFPPATRTVLPIPDEMRNGH